MHNRNITLQFPDLKCLVDYSITIDIIKCEVVEEKFRLICDLTTKEIELAVNGCGAEVIE